MLTGINQRSSPRNRPEQCPFYRAKEPARLTASIRVPKLFPDHELIRISMENTETLDEALNRYFGFTSALVYVSYAYSNAASQIEKRVIIFETAGMRLQKRSTRALS